MSVFETNREAIEQLIIQVIMQEGEPPLNENLEIQINLNRNYNYYLYII